MLSKTRIFAIAGAVLLAGCKQNVVIEVPKQEAGTVSLALKNQTDQVLVEQTADGTKYTVKANAAVTFTAAGIGDNEFEQWLFTECAPITDKTCQVVVTKSLVATALFGPSTVQKVYLAPSEHGTLHFPKLESAYYLPTGPAANTTLKTCDTGTNGELCASYPVPQSGEVVKLHVRAAPAPGYVLDQWSSNCVPEAFQLFCEYDSSSTDRVISATFRPVDGERLTLKQVPIADKEWALMYWNQINGVENEYADTLLNIPALQYRPGVIASQDRPLSSLQGVEYFPQASFLGAYVRQDADFSALASTKITRIALATGYDNFDQSPQGGKFDMSRLPSLPLLEDLELSAVDADVHSSGFVPDVAWPELPKLKRLQIESIIASDSANIFSFANFQQFPSLDTVALIGAISQESVNAVADGGYPYVSISTDNSALTYEHFNGGSWIFLDIWPKSLQTSTALIESRNNADNWTLSVGGQFYNQLIALYPEKAGHLTAY